MSELNGILGGLDKLVNNNQQILTISGGFNKKTQHIENNIVIGNMTKNYVKDKIVEWTSFKKIYYKNGKLDPIYYDKFLSELNNIFFLPSFTDNDNELIYFITNIYASTPDEIANGMIKTINIYDPLKHAIRYLFISYKIYIENLIEIFVNSRNHYIEQEKLNDINNNFDELVEKWNRIDIENKVNTSSPILFFNFPNRDIVIDESVPRIHWEIKKTNNNEKINKFLKIINDSNFYYPGFCPFVAIQRLLLLLKFPVNKLIEIILDLNHKYKKNKYKKINKLSLEIVKNIEKLTPHVKNIYNFDKIKISQKKMPRMNKFPKLEPVKNKIKLFETYIELYIKTYKDIMPFICKKESYINDIALEINNIAKDIQNITVVL